MSTGIACTFTSQFSAICSLTVQIDLYRYDEIWALDSTIQELDSQMKAISCMCGIWHQCPIQSFKKQLDSGQSSNVLTIHKAGKMANPYL